MAKVWPTYRHYLASAEWAGLRHDALARDGWRCRLCNSPSRLQPHHRRYPRFWQDDDVENLTTLCEACHKAHHKRWSWRTLWTRAVLLAAILALIVWQ